MYTLRGNNPHCTGCRLSASSSTVCDLGGGDRQPDVLIIQEKPGPLHRMLAKELAGFSVYTGSAVSCIPPEGKSGGTKAQLKACNDWIQYRIRKLKPLVVLLVGAGPVEAVTGKRGITKMRGRPFEQDNTIYLPVVSPGMVFHDERYAHLFERDLDLCRDILEFGGIPYQKKLNLRIVLNWADVDDMLADLSGEVSHDIETTGLYPWSADAAIVSIGFGTKHHQWILPVVFQHSPWTADEIDEIVGRIDERLQDCYLIAHNGKFDLLWMKVHFGVEWYLDFDTMLAHYILNENDRHGLKYLAMMYLGAPDWEVDLDTKQGAGSLDALAKYHGHDLYYTRELCYVLSKMLREDTEVRNVFEWIIMPIARLFIEIEYDGVYIDTDKFDEAEEVFRATYDDALRSLKKWEPEYVENAKGRREPFNWGSPKQLGKLLFEDLGIPVVERTEAGNPSCSESVIKRIDHPCTTDLLRFRGAKQKLSFFIDGWKPFLHTLNSGQSFLHPSFKIHGTVTGRLSCEHPNLQQVPRDPRIRQLITAPPGWVLLEWDLSQIELRIAAELANERSMLHAFANGVDVHWLTTVNEIARGAGQRELVLDTARTWRQDPLLNYARSIETLLEMGPGAASEIRVEWKELRKKAKAINFGYLYGMWWRKFKEYARDNYDIVVDDKTAQSSREFFFHQYPGFNPWHDRQRRYAAKHGYVKSLSGRKRRLPDAKSAPTDAQRKAAQRQAINSPVQSFANEINLMAALQLREEFPRDVLRLCGTVHDAILARARIEHAEEIHKRGLEIMSWPDLMDDFQIEISVPIEAEGTFGPWGRGVSLKQWKEQQRG